MHLHTIHMKNNIRNKDRSESPIAGFNRDEMKSRRLEEGAAGGVGGGGVTAIAEVVVWLEEVEVWHAGF